MLRFIKNISLSTSNAVQHGFIHLGERAFYFL